MSTATQPADILDRMRRIQADTAGVMEAARWVEWLLANRFNAPGSGIHSRLSVVERQLPRDLVADLRYLASVRNDFAHNPVATVRRPDRFVQTAQRSVSRLLALPVGAAAPAVGAPPAFAGPRAAPRRMSGVVATATFWAVVVVGGWLYGQAPPRPAAVEGAQPPAAVVTPASPRAEPRPRAATAAPAAERPAPRARAAAAKPEAEAVPDAGLPADDASLSIEEVRKLKSSF